jgi:hypothetical protein
VVRSWLPLAGKSPADLKWRKAGPVPHKSSSPLYHPNFDFLEDRIVPAGPSVLSIVRGGPATTNASSVTYQVTFDEAVTGVDNGDFALVRSGTTSATIASSNGSGAVYTVLVSPASGDGTLGLNLINNGTIKDGGGNALTTSFVGATYAIDHTGPVVQSFARTTPTASPTNAGAATYTLIFSEPVTGVDPISRRRQQVRLQLPFPSSPAAGPLTS